MDFAKHDQVIQTLSADGAYDSLGVRVLPGGPWCSRDLFHAHCVNSISEVLPVDSIAVSDKKSRRNEWEGINDLLSSPFGAGICRDVEVNNSSPVMPENDEYVQHTKRRGRQGKEVASRDIPNVIVQKRTPSLRRRLARANHVLGYRPFGDIVA